MLTSVATLVLSCTVYGSMAPEQLVREADTIVLARAASWAAPKPPAEAQRDRSLARGLVTFVIVETLKGKAPGTLQLGGQVATYKGPNTGKVPYPSARRGADAPCFAYDYKLDALFLLIMRGGTPYFAALAPANEEVTGKDDPWVVWVRAQLR